MSEQDRLFIGIYPCGIVYADRQREEHGDYKRLAFLPYDTLTLDLKRAVPISLRDSIREHAATVIARRGQQFEISACGQTVTLGK